MSSGYSFGAKPTGPSAFGQTPTFGAQQPGSITFGTPATTTPQFGSTFGTGTAAFQFNTPASTAPATSLNFGSPAAPNAGSGFGFATTTANLPFASAAPSTNLFAPQASAAPAGSSFGFGTAVSTTGGTGIAFGAPAVPGGSFNFNATAPNAPAANTGLGFGLTSTAPSTGFGAVASSAPAFGATTTSGLSFGTPAPDTVLPFAAPTPTTNFGFGTTTSAPLTGFNFSTPAPATVPSAGLSFGTSAAAPTLAQPAAPGGLPFSTPVTTSGGLNFGIATPAAPATGFGFATPAATTGTGLSFGTPASSAINTGLPLGGAPAAVPGTGLAFRSTAISAPSTGISFGASVTPSTGLSFGAIATSAPATTNLLLGQKPISAPTTGVSFATAPAATTTTGLLFGATPATTTTAATALSFAAPVPAATTTVAGFGIGLGTTAATTSTAGLSFGLGGSLLKPPTTVSTGFNLTSATTTAAPIATAIAAATTEKKTVGLGGISTTSSGKEQASTTTTTTTQAETIPRDQAVPNEIMQTVESFKSYIKDQKTCSSEIARFSIKDLKTVGGDTDVVNSLINELENELQRNKGIAEKLKFDTAEALQHAEMAQRTFDVPSGLQYDNTAPLQFFIELTNNFEKDMSNLKQHIENVNKAVKNRSVPSTLTPEDLSSGMHRLHDTFVALAGRLQMLHSQVEYQKEQYLNLRKKLLNDYTNVFETRSQEFDAFETAFDNVAVKLPSNITGPTPFNSLGNSHAQAVAQNISSTYPGTSLGPPPASGFGATGASTLPLFGSNLSSNTSSLFNTSSSAGFQLQKPPIGNKRGKP